ncbi:MAG: hypothetical protein COV48_11380 [Elusimicrobia bacterium CG11_big_fil_rev_8_21_14_0_20_64_6]|nr:MAG: hypothetical protein COV48_11380 [Elusimicrobia bacterium CG11_big_fil_rev_8_21_14_0_20_64_6]
MITTTLVLLLASAGSASAAPAPVVSTSSVLPIGASTQTVSSLYTGDRVRDPFLPASMGSARVHRVEDVKNDGPEVVDIHGFMLRGLMTDRRVSYALFTAEGGGTYLLRGGRLYNERNKRVPGISGSIKLKQKTVELIAPDKDVQVFRLGEDDKEQEKP